MSRSNADLLALKAELTNDPNSLGLIAPPTVADVQNADLLNLVRPEIQLDRKAVPASEVAKAINRVEYNAATLADRQWMDMVLNTGLIDPSPGTEARNGLLGIFGPGTTTRTNFQALLTQSGNRIEQMFQQGLLEKGGTVTPSDIANARNAS